MRRQELSGSVEGRGPFVEDRVGPDVRRRIRRDVETGLASADVRGTPTLFIDGVVYVGCYDVASLMEALSR